MQNPTSNPRVQFFVRLPGNGKADIANRKIPNLSKIQGKLARLNEAISEGLANERRQQLEARLLRNSQAERAAASAASTSSSSSSSPPPPGNILR